MILVLGAEVRFGYEVLLRCRLEMRDLVCIRHLEDFRVHTKLVLVRSNTNIAIE